MRAPVPKDWPCRPRGTLSRRWLRAVQHLIRGATRSSCATVLGRILVHLQNFYVITYTAPDAPMAVTTGAGPSRDGHHRHDEPWRSAAKIGALARSRRFPCAVRRVRVRVPSRLLKSFARRAPSPSFPWVIAALFTARALANSAPCVRRVVAIVLPLHGNATTTSAPQGSVAAAATASPRITPTSASSRACAQGRAALRQQIALFRAGTDL